MPPITFRGDTIFVIYIHQNNLCVQEEFEDTKEVIRIRKTKKNIQHNGHKKKGPTAIYKTLHIKLKIE